MCYIMSRKKKKGNQLVKLTKLDGGLLGLFRSIDLFTFIDNLLPFHFEQQSTDLLVCCHQVPTRLLNHFSLLSRERNSPWSEIRRGRSLPIYCLGQNVLDFAK